MQREYNIKVRAPLATEEVAVLERSSGEHPIIAWHGIAFVNRLWRWDMLWPHGRVILAGLPGHGPVRAQPNRHYELWTPQHFIDVAIETTRFLARGKPATLIGHSTGAMLALGVATQAPELVARLILVSPVVWNDLGGIIGSWLTVAQHPALCRSLIGATLAPGRLLRSAYLASIPLFVHDPQGTFSNPRVYQSVVEGYPHYQRTPIAAIAGTAGILRRTDLRPDIQRCPPRVPTLIIHGDRDGIVPIRQAEWVLGKLPMVELATMHGIGHVPFAEREAEFSRIVQEWCEWNPVGGS
jgi:pimeloyl-ACP methyl ester carboxylesterase